MKMISTNLLRDFPVRQQNYRYDCGTCSLWCVLKYLGYDFSYEEVLKLSKTDEEEGTLGENIEKALKDLDIKFIAEKSTISKLKSYANANCPSIVSIQHRKEYKKPWEQTLRYGHYVVVLAVDNNKVIFMDPNYGKIRAFSIKDFKQRWQDGDENVIYKYPAITCFA